MSNMESMLMGDDSSSGESDDEVDVPTGRAAGTTAGAVPAAPRPAIATAPVAAPNPSSAQDQMKERLKNLYSSQNKRPTTSSQLHSSSAHPQGAPINSRPGMPQPSNAPPNSRPQSHAPPSMTSTIPPAQPRMGISRPPAQPRPQQVMQPVRSPLPQQPTQPSQYSRSSHPSQPSRTSHGHPQSHPHRPSQPAGEVHDPFAPTPLSRIKAREQQQFEAQRRMPPTGGSRTASSVPGSYSGAQNSGASSMYPSGASGRTSGHDPAAMAVREQEVRRQKEKFLVFTRVLIKYLENKDPTMHRQAKAIIKDCAERNKNKEPGYQSVTASMKTRLKQLVGENYWKRAEAYLKHFLEQKAKANQSGSAPSSSTHSRQQLALQKQQQQKHQQQKQQQQRQKLAQAQAQRQSQMQPPNLSTIQQDVVNRKTEIARGGARTPPASGASTTSSKGSAASKKQAASKRKSGATPASRKSTTLTPTVMVGSPSQVGEKVEDPPREYVELMEMVDHAVQYDWKSAGQLINSKAELQVDEEQRKLLYGDSKPRSAPVDTVVPRPGWDKSNVFSARAAWAKVRLSEQKGTPHAPVVGGGLLTLPTATAPTPATTTTAWTNEQAAEQDIVLAMLSESCQTYLKGILQKAVRCARQRQNVDGIRLWHQQHAASEKNQPALSLRLGCDVSRQVAQAHGNAAMTCKRMEEALERQGGVPARSRILKGETLEEATSMADLSLRPELGKGVENADHQAKKLFETHGGKHSSEPPLGRVPKKAKIESVDLINGSNLTDTVGRHRAVTTSVSAFY